MPPSSTTTDPLLLRTGRLHEFDPDVARERGIILLVDKPLDWTSFDVVAKCRNVFGVRKVGHAGTLDPLATGLLILCFGRATKRVEALQAEVKEYVGTIRLGATTETEDAEGEEQEVRTIEEIAEKATPEMIEETAASFLGTSMQIPPMFSARKVKGKRLYKLAREGKTVERPPRPITIDSFAIERIDLPHIEVRIVCSKGTYIRSIARDFGSRLGLGGYLSGLRRTRSGEFRVEEGASIDEILRHAELSNS